MRRAKKLPKSYYQKQFESGTAIAVVIVYGIAWFIGWIFGLGKESKR